GLGRARRLLAGAYLHDAVCRTEHFAQFGQSRLQHLVDAARRLHVLPDLVDHALALGGLARALVQARVLDSGGQPVDQRLRKLQLGARPAARTLAPELQHADDLATQAQRQGSDIPVTVTPHDRATLALVGRQHRGRPAFVLDDLLTVQAEAEHLLPPRAQVLAPTLARQAAVQFVKLPQRCLALVE